MMMGTRNIVARSFAAVALALIISSCGSRQYLVRPAPQAADFNRIAVFPFENLSGVPEAGGRVTNMLVAELHNANVVDVVEPGEVQDFILRSRIRFASQLDLDAIREASRQLNADGIIFGSVNEYSVITTDLGPLPAVSVTVRLINAASGDIVWSTTTSLQGDFKETLFGIGRVNSIGTLAEILITDVVEALRVAMYPDAAGARSVEWAPKKERTRADAEPVLPLAPVPADAKSTDLEKEKARSNVLQEWDTIKKLSQ